MTLPTRLLRAFPAVTLGAVLVGGAGATVLSAEQPPKEHLRTVTPMTKTPLEVVRAFNAAMEKMDFETALKSVSDDCEYSNGSRGTVYGHAGVRRVLEPFFALMVENTFVILREAANESIVFMERLDRHRLATGGWIELPVTGVYEVRNGRIAVYHDYFDSVTIDRQLQGRWAAGRQP